MTLLMVVAIIVNRIDMMIVHHSHSNKKGNTRHVVVLMGVVTEVAYVGSLVVLPRRNCRHNKIR